MDVFQEMPLNKAHMYERRAKRYLGCGNVDEAVKCFQLASEYILKTMETTSSIKSLQSLQLQYESYLSQCNVRTREKGQLAVEAFELSCGQVDTKMELITTPTEVFDLKPQSEVQFDSNSQIHKLQDREPDSLLQFLNPGQVENKETSQRKYPKVDQDIIEELRTQNQYFKILVQNLLEKQESLEVEKRLLAEKVETLQLELSEMKQQDTDEFDSNCKGESEGTHVTPHFVLDQDVEPTSIVQQQSFFHFDDPLIAHQIQNAMHDVRALTHEHPLSPVYEEESDAINTTSLRYEELEDA